MGIRILSYHIVLNNMKSAGPTKENPPDQQRLLEQIATLIPKNVSLVAVLADILDISHDSAYRRIRGETELSFSETLTLCNHFQITFDSLISTDVNVVSFIYNDYTESLESFHSYFIGLGDEMDQIRMASVENKHITFLGPGIPVLHFFNSPHLGAFKIYYWIKSMNLPDARYKKFNISSIDEAFIETGQRIYENYMHIPSTEIWTDYSMIGVMNQIRFCWDTGVFESADDAMNVCNELQELLTTIKEQAEHGEKFIRTEDEETKGALFNLYYSELEDENTCIHVELDDFNTVYLGHLNHRFIKTSNKAYCATTKGWYKNLEKKSTLISQTSESVRYQFFKRGFDKLSELEDHISNQG